MVHRQRENCMERDHKASVGCLCWGVHIDALNIKQGVFCSVRNYQCKSLEQGTVPSRWGHMANTYFANNIDHIKSSDEMEELFEHQPSRSLRSKISEIPTISSHCLMVCPPHFKSWSWLGVADVSQYFDS